MAVAAASPSLHGRYLLHSKLHYQAPSIRSNQTKPIRPQSSLPPIFVSTSPSHANPNQIRDLCISCNHSFHRFPNLLPDGAVEPVDAERISVAVAHSSVVVSVFAKPELNSKHPSETADSLNDGGKWLQRVIPVTPFTGKLVGFGRAVSDIGLTASIYDVMVIPSLQGRGIGRTILKRIIRMLTNRGVYDIAALCSEKDRPFFKACGFGDDLLGSTTMMYRRTDSGSLGKDTMVRAGKMSLLIPPRESCQA